MTGCRGCGAWPCWDVVVTLASWDRGMTPDLTGRIFGGHRSRSGYGARSPHADSLTSGLRCGGRRCSRRFPRAFLPGCLEAESRLRSDVPACPGTPGAVAVHIRPPIPPLRRDYRRGSVEGWEEWVGVHQQQVDTRRLFDGGTGSDPAAVVARREASDSGADADAGGIGLAGRSAHDVNTNLVFKWRRDPQRRSATAAGCRDWR